jgi:Ca2+-binding RTX toxin-like protein
MAYAIRVDGEWPADWISVGGKSGEGRMPNITGGNTGNFVLSKDGSRLFVAGADGKLRTYDVASGDLIKSSTIGTKLGAISISPDGKFLIVTEQKPLSFDEDPGGWPENNTKSAIYKVDLGTGAVQTLVYESTGSDYVLADVAITSAGTVLFSQNILPGWGGWTPIVTLDLRTGTFAKTEPSYYQAGSLTVAPDGATVLYGQLNLSSAQAYVFSPRAVRLADNGIYENGVYGYAGGVEAYTGAGPDGRVAISTGGRVHLWTGEFEYLRDLTALNSELSDIVGLRFSADGKKLFAVSAGTDQVYVISLANYSILNVLAVGGDVGSISAWGDEIVEAPGGAFLLVSTLEGVQRIDLENVATGSAGHDRFEGLWLSDIYSGRGGNDIIHGNDGHDRLHGDAGEDRIFGNSGNDILAGGDGNDRLDGGVGADTMEGGGGVDSYVVDNAGDLVVELAGMGTDAVLSSVDYALTANVEHLTLTGKALKGTGNALANVIVGNAQANILDGGAGVDRLEGGKGDDTYVVDTWADVVLEVSGQGHDIVRSSANFVLPDHVEDLVLTGGGNIKATGNGLDNAVTGNAGNNILDGRGGADVMKGGKGHDRYVVDNVGDQVIEEGSSGKDVVESSVSYRLPTHFEELYLTGTWSKDGTGNSADNKLVGNIGHDKLNGLRGEDRIDGGAGNDMLYGSEGDDVLIGGAGKDKFLFNKAPGTGELNAGVDDILDFSVTDDLIYLANYAFTRIGPKGALNPNAFHKGTDAADVADRIIYDQASGSIYYDADGSGAAAKILFATVDPGTLLTNADFVVYG